MDEPTNGEIMRRLDSIVESQTRLEDRISTQLGTFISRELFEARMSQVEGTVAGHSSWLLWIGRTVVGVIILAILAGVVATGGGLPA